MAMETYISDKLKDVRYQFNLAWEQKKHNNPIEKITGISWPWKLTRCSHKPNGLWRIITQKSPSLSEHQEKEPDETVPYLDQGNKMSL